MKSYTIIKTEAVTLGGIDISTEVIYSTNSLEEAKIKHREVAKEFFENHLLTGWSNEFLADAKENPELLNFDYHYQNYISTDGMWWGVSCYKESIAFQILEIEIKEA